MTDSGIGIPRAEIGQVFDRFARGSNAKAASLPGTGLGLSVVKAVADLHGGLVEGDSVEAAWSLVDPILDVWSAAKTATVPQYPSGSWGPREADVLLEREGRQWFNS